MNFIFILGLVCGIAIGSIVECFIWVRKLQKRNLFRVDGSLKVGKPIKFRGGYKKT